MNLAEISTLIEKRRAIFPKTYLEGREIDRVLIEKILENANWAPSHKHTEPWRFRVFHSKPSRDRLGDWLLEINQNGKTEPIPAEKAKKIAKNPRRSGCVVVVSMKMSGLVPEWEELAAVSCAVQNMWLTCSAIGLGSYWSTMSAAMGRAGADFFDLETDEKCVGLFYIGWHEMPEIVGKRGSIEAKTRWF